MWRLVLGLVVVILVFAALNSLALLIFAWRRGIGALDPLLASLAVASTPSTALTLLASFAPLAIGTVAAARLLHKRGPATLLGPLRPMVHDFLRAALTSFALIGSLSVLGLVLVDSEPYLPVRLWAMLLPLTILAIAIQTLAEELLFRGYLQQQLAALVAWRIVWMGLPAVVFGAMHHDPSTYGGHSLVPVGFAFLFGLISADLTARTGTLGAAWGAHFAINMIGIAFVGVTGSITGLALRTVTLHPEVSSGLPILALTDVAPLLLLWIVLRRVLRR